MANRTYQPHYSTADDPRTVRTREALQDALLRLLEHESLGQITIRKIAANANISYVTFFRHYPTKEALLRDIAKEQVRRLTDLILPAIDARGPQATSMALCVYVDYNPKRPVDAARQRPAAALREKFLRHAARVAVSRSEPTN